MMLTLIQGCLLSMVALFPSQKGGSPMVMTTIPDRTESILTPMDDFSESPTMARSQAFGRAGEAFKAKEYGKVLAILDRELKDSDDPEVWNLRGAVMTELKRYDEARPCFARVLERKPDHFWARFNLAELELLGGRHAAAREAFRAMKKGKGPENELLDLKIVLSHLAEKQTMEARSVVEAIPETSLTAAGYAARAALAFAEGRKAEARSWLSQAETVHPGQMDGFLRQTLEEAGLTPAALAAD